MPDSSAAFVVTGIAAVPATRDLVLVLARTERAANVSTVTFDHLVRLSLDEAGGTSSMGQRLPLPVDDLTSARQSDILDVVAIDGESLCAGAGRGAREAESDGLRGVATPRDWHRPGRPAVDEMDLLFGRALGSGAP